MLHKCCLIHLSTIVLAQSLYLKYLCPCQGLGLFKCELFLFFIFIFIVINHTILLKRTHLFFVQFLEYVLLFLDDKEHEESEWFSNSKSSALGCCLALTRFFPNFSLVLLKKVLLIKKSV